MVAKTLLEDLLGEEDYIEKGLEEDKKLAPILEEICLLEDAAIRSFVRAVLLAVPHFFTAPVSTRDELINVFPPDEMRPGGLVLHTQRVVRIAHLMCEAQGRSRAEIDIVLAAALIHDVTRIVELGSPPNVIQMEDPYHSITIDKFLEAIEIKEKEENKVGSTMQFLEPEVIALIIRLVHTHLGSWSPIPEVMPVTSLEWLLHFADTISSKLHFIIDGVNLDEKRWS